MKPASISALHEDWPALSALLDDALALPPDERDAWLAGLDDRPGLPSISAQHRETLRVLLATQAEIETGDFLAALPPLPPEPPPHAGAAPGAIVGPYRLITQIGQGGMASVWLAERADGLMKRQVALKLPAVAWGEAFATRLAREREILASLTHEHIARLYDAGVDAQGRPYLAMEVIAGVPIDVFCRERSLPLAERIDLLLQVMAAVAHAHARLVVHRDLKPSNILVSADAKVSLLDFGIAKLLEGELTEETALTRAAGHALTPDYASPEQIRGEPLGTASDVYSLAVVAYELLAGARPYRLKRASAAELAQAIAEAEPPLASEMAADKALKRQLRGDLDAILNNALKKRPDERYVTMDAFAQDLQRWRDGKPVQARPDGLAYRVAKFVGRYRLQVVAGSLVVAALAAGATVALWQAREARLEADRARTEAATAKAVRGFIESIFLTNTANQDDPQRARATTARELLDRGAERIQRELASQPDAQFELCGLMYEMYVHMGLNERAAVIARRRLALATRVYGPDDPRTLGVSVGLAKALLEMNQRDEARSLLEGAGARAAVRPDADELRMTIAGALAFLYFNTDPPQALVQARLAAELARGKPPTQETVNAQQMLGDTANITGHLQEAEAAFTEAQAQIARQPEAAQGGLPLILASLGEVQDKLGRVDSAGATLARARALAERAGDPYSLHIASYRLASYQRRNGLLREALSTAAADDAWGRTAGPDFGTLPVSMAAQHARVLVDYGDPAHALAVIDSVRAKLPEVPPSLQGPMLAVRAEALVALGRAAEADADLQRATELVSGAVAASSDVVDTVRIARRRYWQATGRAAEALDDLRQGAAAAPGVTPTALAATRRQAEEARLLWAAGRADEAQAIAAGVLTTLQTLPERHFAWQAEAEAAEVLGRALLAAGNAAGAAPHLAQAVSLRDAQEDPQKSPALAAALLARAACHRAMGDAAAATADTARASRIQAAASSR